MHFRAQLLTGLAAVLLNTAALAEAVTINGVRVEDNATVAGVKLPLHGAGTRYKGPFKIFVGDMYVSKKVRSLDEFIAAPGPKRLSMTFVREVESGPLGKMLVRSVEDNITKSDMPRLVPGLVRMGGIFTGFKSMAPGDVVTFDWIPGTGMVLTLKGTVLGEPFPELEFFKAMASAWLGPTPADYKFKDALLGIE